ncbi:hypothetical protein VPHD181_0038 [Vibrio phage D181]
MAFNGYCLCFADDEGDVCVPLYQTNGRMWIFGKPEPAYEALGERRESLRNQAKSEMVDVGSIFRTKMEHTESSRNLNEMADTLDVVHISILKGHKDEDSKTRDTAEREGVAGNVSDVQECDGGDGE